MSELLSNMLIPCPETGFILRSVSACFKCDYYNGLSRPKVNGEPIDCKPTEVQVICARPITRSLTMWINQ